MRIYPKLGESLLLTFEGVKVVAVLFGCRFCQDLFHGTSLATVDFLAKTPSHEL